MTRMSLLGATALGSAAFIGLTLATPASAQSTSPDPRKTSPTQPDQPQNLGQNETELESGRSAASTATPGEAIVVTGTRINRPNLTSTVPITSVGAQELTSSGKLSLGDTLNELPQLRQTFSQ